MEGAGRGWRLGGWVLLAWCCAGGGGLLRGADYDTLPATLWTGDTVTLVCDLPRAGEYDLRVQGGEGHPIGAGLRIEFDGAVLVPGLGSGEVAPVAAPWRVHERLVLPAGRHTLRVVVEQILSEAVCLNCRPEVNPADHIYRYDPVPHVLEAVTLVPSAPYFTGAILAGDAEAGYRDGLGTEARFGDFRVTTRCANGDILVGDTPNARLRRVSPSGVVTTVAGSGRVGQVDGAAAGCEFEWFVDLAEEPDGGVLVLERLYQPGPLGAVHALRRVSAAGEVSTLFRGEVPTGAPPLPPAGPNYTEPVFLLWRLHRTPPGEWQVGGSYSYYWIMAIECSPWGCIWEPEPRRATVHALHAVSPEGTLTRLTNHYSPPGPYVTNLFGEVFWTSGDRVMRGDPAGAAQTLHRVTGLTRVVSTLDAEVIVAVGRALVRVADPGSPVVRLTVRQPRPPDTISPAPVWPVPLGSTVRLRAQSGDSARFMGWTGDASGNNEWLDLVMDADKTVGAQFGFGLELVAGRGRVETEPPGPLYPRGMPFLARFTPDPGYTRVLWSDGVTSAVRQVVLHADWSFGVVAHNPDTPVVRVDVATEPPGAGTIVVSKPPKVYAGSPVAVQAQPKGAYVFARWEDGGTAPRRWVMADGTTVFRAVFELPAAYRPSLGYAGRHPNGDAAFLATGSPGSTYQLLGSGDLVSWTSVTRFVMDGSGTAEISTGLGEPRWFLRLDYVP